MWATSIHPPPLIIDGKLPPSLSSHSKRQPDMKHLPIFTCGGAALLCLLASAYLHSIIFFVFAIIFIILGWLLSLDTDLWKAKKR